MSSYCTIDVIDNRHRIVYGEKDEITILNNELEYYENGTYTVSSKYINIECISFIDTFRLKNLVIGPTFVNLQFIQFCDII